jgi:acetyl esterase/lipase
MHATWRWVRQHASELGIDPDHVAVYGTSSGGHLAASLAFFGAADKNQISAVPNAALLISPAVGMAHNEYFQGLLAKRALASEYSPEEQMPNAPPPTIIFNGSLDDLTPLDGVKLYCDRAGSMEANANCTSTRATATFSPASSLLAWTLSTPIQKHGLTRRARETLSSQREDFFHCGTCHRASRRVRKRRNDKWADDQEAVTFLGYRPIRS